MEGQFRVGNGLPCSLALAHYVRRPLPGRFAVEYSTLYLTDRFTPGVLPKEEPLHQFIPLVEFAFDSPVGQRTRGTVNPGIAYVKDTWQVAAELVLPLTHGSTRGVGANVQVLFFLDDFMPSLFGTPLLDR